MASHRLELFEFSHTCICCRHHTYTRQCQTKTLLPMSENRSPASCTFPVCIALCMILRVSGTCRDNCVEALWLDCVTMGIETLIQIDSTSCVTVSQILVTLGSLPPA